MKKPHKSVLLQEVLEYLQPKQNINFVDATLGFAGHSKEILKLTEPKGMLIGIDQDNQALEFSKKELESFGERFIPFKGNFDQIVEAVGEIKVTGGILADLGVSSLQLDEGERGFSFQKKGPLDMRMSQDAELTAADVINDFTESELAEIIYKYSDEKFAKRIASRIVAARELSKIVDTQTLAEIVSGAIPRKFWPKGINPATRTFQAVRIAVNDEMGALERFLPQAVDLLESGARMGIITFHSLEDKIVKDYFKKESTACTCPPNFPKCVCGGVAKIKIINRKAIRPNESELDENPRSRSAKLRVIEKI